MVHVTVGKDIKRKGQLADARCQDAQVSESCRKEKEINHAITAMGEASVCYGRQYIANDGGK